MRVLNILVIAAVFISGVVQAEAGFLDDIIKKTTDKVQQAVEETVDEHVDKTLDIEKISPAEQSFPGTGEPAVGGAPGVADTSNRAIALAVVKLAPSFFDLRPELQQKELLLQIFPEEGKIRTNEFYWQKNREALISKAKALAANASTSFQVAPWIDNSPKTGYGQQQANYFVATFGNYDFEKKAFPVYPLQVRVPWLAADMKSNVAGYQIIGIEQMKENHWVPMSIDAAEKLTTSLGGAGTGRAYGHFTYTITEVVGLENLKENPEYPNYEKYLQMGGNKAKMVKDKLRPYFNVVIEGKKIDLYVPKETVYQVQNVIPQNSLKLFTTLYLDSETAASQAAAVSDVMTEKEAAPKVLAADRNPTRENILRGIIRLAPDILTKRPDDQVKNMLLILYPDEVLNFKNDFYWYKNKEAIIQKTIAESANASTTFEVAPWGNLPGQHSNGVWTTISKYDFQKRGFYIFPFQLRLPWLPSDGRAMATFEIVGGFKMPDFKNLEDERHWVNMDIDQAEKLYEKLGHNTRIVGAFTYTIERIIGLDDLKKHPQYNQYAKQLESGGPAAEGAFANLAPVAKITIKENKIDFYAPEQKTQYAMPVQEEEQLDYITSLRFTGN
jgi:hypothetical protein